MPWALAFLLGCCAVYAGPQIPSTTILSILVALAFIFFAFGTWRKYLSFTLSAIFLLAFSWSAYQLKQATHLRLDESRCGENLAISGQVISLPKQYSDAVSFDFLVEPNSAFPGGGVVRLSSYDKSISVKAGARYELAAKFKRPHGSANAAGFDFERYALLNRIVATGSVQSFPKTKIQSAPTGMQAWREQISNKIHAAINSPRIAALASALAVGDTRELRDDDWQSFRQTGVTHLIAISGLHVAMAALAFGLIIQLLYFLWPTMAMRLPRRIAVSVAAIIGATFYAFLAGFEIPTQRTLFGIVVASSFIITSRHCPPWRAYAGALLGVLLIDPLSVLAAGFWLSFSAVAWLLFAFTGHQPAPGKFRTVLTAQLLMSLALLPLSLHFFGSASLISPVANLWAVPLVTLLCVPLLLAGVAMIPISTFVSNACFQMASIPLGWFVRGIDYFAHISLGFSLHLHTPKFAVFSAALAVIVWLVRAPKLCRVLTPFLLLPLLSFPRQNLRDGEFDLRILDVGQGSAALLQTRNTAIVIDTGAARAEGVDYGESVVTPALLSAGVSPHLIFVSHGDNDHAGGLEYLRTVFPSAQIFTSDLEKFPTAHACLSGQFWLFDGVRLDVLHPNPGLPYMKNDSSCVLRISGSHGSVLLPGDIGEAAEERLVHRYGSRLQADILIVPHHGSKSSSSDEFVAAVAPELAIISAGYRNRFGLPSTLTLKRYATAHIRVLETAKSGEQLILGRLNSLTVQRERQVNDLPWREAEPTLPSPEQVLSALEKQ
jgi:competence protein ComEC